MRRHPWIRMGRAHARTARSAGWSGSLAAGARARFLGSNPSVCLSHLSLQARRHPMQVQERGHVPRRQQRQIQSNRWSDGAQQAAQPQLPLLPAQDRICTLATRAHWSRGRETRPETLLSARSCLQRLYVALHIAARAPAPPVHLPLTRHRGPRRPRLMLFEPLEVHPPDAASSAVCCRSAVCCSPRSRSQHCPLPPRRRHAG